MGLFSKRWGALFFGGHSKKKKKILLRGDTAGGAIHNFAQWENVQQHGVSKETRDTFFAQRLSLPFNAFSAGRRFRLVERQEQAGLVGFPLLFFLHANPLLLSPCTYRM